MGVTFRVAKTKEVAGRRVSVGSCHSVLVLPVPGAFCIPVYIPYNLTGRWMLGKGLCKVWLVMDYLLCTASVFNIVLISYDRFLSVTRAVSMGCTHTLAHSAKVTRYQTKL